MINQLHARMRRPERGWDPVPAAHAAEYGAGEHRLGADQGLLDELESLTGGWAGKSVLDLGGGPGHYAIAMAQRGARVTWHDVSARYAEMSRQKAVEAGVLDRITFSLGYLDETPPQWQGTFDLVFNRICWYYCIDDRSFAKTFYGLVRPGGFGYVDTTHSGYQRDRLSATARARTWLNERTGIKIGHPYPPHGRIASLFGAMPVARLWADYRMPTNDRVLFQKAPPSE